MQNLPTSKNNHILAPKYPYINLGLQELANHEQYGDQDTKEALNVQPLSLAS